MARYGANELFNPGSGRRKKKSGTGVTTGSSSGSLGSMPHSQAPDALGMLTSALSLGEEVFGKDDIKHQEPEDKASFIKRLGKKKQTSSY